MMGRAERRAAAKRAKKGGGGKGQSAGRSAGRSAAASDVVSKEVVEARLGGVPVFGLLAPGAGFLKQGNEVVYYMDAREAERQCAASELGSAVRVEGRPLNEIFFDPTCRLKPCDDALREMAKVPAERTLCTDVRTPLYCIDGFQTKDKETGVESLPLFFSRARLACELAVAPPRTASRQRALGADVT